MSLGALFALVCTLARASSPAPSDGKVEPARTGTGEPDAVVPDGDARMDRVEAEMERLRGRVDDLETENAELREEQDLAYEEREALHERIDRPKRARFAFGGYLDAGLYWAQGTGAGVMVDENRDQVDGYGDVSEKWVFFGDPLSTAVNARGEPADTGDSVAIQFDSVDSLGGGPPRLDLGDGPPPPRRDGSQSSFIVNAVNFSVRAGLGEQVVAFTMVDIVPRGRDVGATDGFFLGDFIDLKLAYVMWRPPIQRFALEVYGGKIDSVFGREYRVQESPKRIEVTPSLICRYTCGRPVGISTRMAFFDRSLSLAASLTNGSTYQETFAFYNEVDRNLAKTATGRIAYELPWAHLQFGASGEIGAQDLQPDSKVIQHQYGFDVHLEARGLEVTAEFLQGRAGGKDKVYEPEMESAPPPRASPCGLAECLFVTGAYGTVAYRALNWLMPFFRTDWRDAVHRFGDARIRDDFVYESRVVRLSPGVRFEITPNVLVKAQYTFNLEVGGHARLLNDVFTSAFVAHF